MNKNGGMLNGFFSEINDMSKVFKDIEKNKTETKIDVITIYEYNGIVEIKSTKNSVVCLKKDITGFSFKIDNLKLAKTIIYIYIKGKSIDFEIPTTNLGAFYLLQKLNDYFGL